MPLWNKSDCDLVVRSLVGKSFSVTSAGTYEGGISTSTLKCTDVITGDSSGTIAGLSTTGISASGAGTFGGIKTGSFRATAVITADTSGTFGGISTGSLTNAGILTNTGAGTLGGVSTTTLTASGLATLTGGASFKGTTTIGASFAMPAGMVAFFGSKDDQAVVLPSGKTGINFCYVRTAGTGTITLTGSGAETWTAAAGGTGTITPGKNVLLISDGAAGWLPVYLNI